MYRPRKLALLLNAVGFWDRQLRDSVQRYCSVAAAVRPDSLFAPRHRSRSEDPQILTLDAQSVQEALEYLLGLAMADPELAEQ